MLKLNKNKKLNKVIKQIKKIFILRKEKK